MKCRVEYCDVSNLWAPLESLFWSSSSNCLVSSHPLSSIEEVQAIYCPQCFRRFTDDEVVRELNGECPGCKRCPICDSPCLSGDNIVCSSCNISWKQSNNRNFVTGHPDLESISHEWERSLKNKELPKEFIEKNSKYKDMSISVPIDLSNCLEVCEKQNSGNNDILDRKDQSIRICGVLLRSKRSLRCRKDFIQGKPNILLQTKGIPLEGDSSMMVQRGKWWTKESFGIHEVPRITVLASTLPSKSSERYLSSKWILRITNPRESPVDLTVDIGNHDKIPSGDFSILSYSHSFRRIENCTGICPLSTIASSSKLTSFSISATLQGVEDELLTSSNTQKEILPSLSLKSQYMSSDQGLSSGAHDSQQHQHKHQHQQGSSMDKITFHRPDHDQCSWWQYKNYLEVELPWSLFDTTERSAGDDNNANNNNNSIQPSMVNMNNNDKDPWFGIPIRLQSSSFVNPIHSVILIQLG